MKKAVNIIYIVFFLGVVIVPLTLTNTKRNVISDFDNRVLVEMPEIGTGNFFDGLESYLQDRIGLRDQIVTGYQLLNAYVARELTHPSYTCGQDGYMFFHMSNNIAYDTYHQAFVDGVASMNQYCRSRGVPFYFMFDPEKASVYRKYLPDGVNYNDEWVDALITELENRGITVVNNKELLSGLSNEEQVFNRQYDAGHWNDLGCFYGTNNLWDTIHKDIPSVTEYSADDFDITTETGEYLAVSKFPVNEQIPVYKLKDKYTDLSNKYVGLNQNPSYRFFANFVNKSQEAKNYPKALVFHGSYYNRGPQFFVGRSSEYIGIHDYQNVLDLDYYFNIFQPDVVVFETAEYTFLDKYYDSGRMASLDYNPSLVEGTAGINNVDDVLRGIKHFDLVGSERLDILPCKGFDVVYFDKELTDARYVYLISGDTVYDLQKSTIVDYGTGIPHNGYSNDSIILYEDYSGNKYYANVGQKIYSSLLDDMKNLTYSSGARYDKSTNQQVYETDVKDNDFNSVVIQKCDAKTGEYIETIASFENVDSYNDVFVNKDDSGWYYIRLKANGNEKDESIDLLTYLDRGEHYYYSLNVDEITNKCVLLSNFNIYGPESTEVKETVIIPSLKVFDNSIKDVCHLSTDVEGNSFSYLAFELSDPESEEVLNTFVMADKTGNYNGVYLNNYDSGEYLLRLRANSNIHDEYIEKRIELDNGSLYSFSFTVDKISESEIAVKGFSFSRLER